MMGILEVVEEMNHVYICGGLTSSLKITKCKSPKARMCQPHSRNSKEVSRVGSQTLNILESPSITLETNGGFKKCIQWNEIWDLSFKWYSVLLKIDWRMEG